MTDEEILKKRKSEKDTVRMMISIYCWGNHKPEKKGSLCPQCQELFEYASARVDHCPHIETKTFCSSCKTHCYKPEMRERIRQVMKYSGPRMMFHFPVLAIRHFKEDRQMKRQKNKAAVSPE